MHERTLVWTGRSCQISDSHCVCVQSGRRASWKSRKSIFSRRCSNVRFISKNQEAWLRCSLLAQCLHFLLSAACSKMRFHYFPGFMMCGEEAHCSETLRIRLIQFEHEVSSICQLSQMSWRLELVLIRDAKPPSGDTRVWNDMERYGDSWMALRSNFNKIILWTF